MTLERAKSEAVVSGLKTALSTGGYGAAAGYDVSALDSYMPGSSLSTRQTNVRLIYLKDEALSLLQDPLHKLVAAAALGLVSQPLGLLAAIPTPNIKGSEDPIDAKATNGNGWGVPLLFNGQPVDLHDMVLLTAFLQSQQLLDASRTNPEVLQKIFTSKLTHLDSFGKDQRFLNLMVQQEQQGNASLEAFAGDIGRLKGEVGRGVIKAALVGLDIGMQYGQGMDHALGVTGGAFQAAIEDVSGGIQFSIQPQYSTWLTESLAEFQKALPSLYADLGVLAGQIDTGADRYTLSTQGGVNASAAADGKRDLMVGSSSGDSLSSADGDDTLVGDIGNDALIGENSGSSMLLERLPWRAPTNDCSWRNAA